jgi:hypothetical protein
MCWLSSKSPYGKLKPESREAGLSGCAEQGSGTEDI